MNLDRKLASLAHAFDSNAFRRGIEKEAIRTNNRGQISNLVHPSRLGSALTHPRITTDFSEAQLEFITDVDSSVEGSLQELDDIHRYVYSVLERETLWPASMPCMLPAEKAIPIATYGNSNEGMAKNIYRRGLANRYGRYMQTISGLHYNFSFAESVWEAYAGLHGVENSREFRDSSYMDLIRNFRRYSWFLIYLFGASPAVCGSFISSSDHGLDQMDAESYFLPYATSLRMGPLGYQSDAQSSLYVSYNSLSQFVEGVANALKHPYPKYKEIGLKDESGEYLQLSTAIIQIEAEFYGAIRPKPKPHSEMRPVIALNQQGIEYLEVRCLDLNPFDRTGINSEIVRFIDAFLIFCWLMDSPLDSFDESREMQSNQLLTVKQGRQPDLELKRNGNSIRLSKWSGEILDGLAEVVSVLDSTMGTREYSKSMELQRQKVVDSRFTPSAQILAQMEASGLGYYSFIKSQADKHRAHYLGKPLTAEKMQSFDELANLSAREQSLVEANQDQTLEEYLGEFMKLDL